MKAVVMTGAGAPDVLELRDLPVPRIERPTQVLVRLKAAGVNPIDTKVRQRGTFISNGSPDILGCDGAGIVEAVGSHVSAFGPGDAVYFCFGGLGGSQGNYAEYAVLEQHCLTPKPQSLSFEEAAAAPLVLITAWEALYDRARLCAGQRVLIQAGAGGVGHVAVQLAKGQGAAVVTTVSDTQKADFVKKLGADLAILYPEEDVVEAVLAWTEGDGVDVAFDTVGGETFYQTCEAVKVYGDVVTLLQPSELGNLKGARQRNLRIGLELMLTPMLLNLQEEQAEQAKILRECGRLFDGGSLRVEVNQVFPLAEAAEAHRQLEAGSMVGKLVLGMD
ncbi:zinc-dependent alcohol dehydrogenase family protein [Phormidium yuhuli AB48]|uniref:Zinc-dependent alcohol dehydrogenase family protein n=1 Tax=Phormidium yuhuli AB48 TaxID=2940671 RepID=A0ABY5AK88_9CYAN|nr:zinc-dependent alcohol dehydrogenase family protein [Phormidium yuhuli]USR89405.1 zinc-dependent alcohol dehydrogenase family protein [Phormidium yuhuli AB48]